MAKIKVYELAKELNVSSKEVVEFLGEKNIEVKSHMSSLEEADAEIVRNSFGKSEKTEEKAAEAPKKKVLCRCSVLRIRRMETERESVRQESRQLLREDRCR
jgi:Translation initiation factor IF-2, N-terminal region